MATAKRALTTAFTDLAAHFGERFSTAQSIRDHHARGETFYPPNAPDAVVFAHTVDDVARAVTICARERIPVIPFGVGSSLEGQVNALHGGVTIDLSQMNRVVRVSADDLDCTVEAGVTRKQLNNHLRDLGIFFPVDPGADASIGGMAATRASGTNAVRYGTLRENVLGLTVVTADGRVMHTGGRARKSAAGYDLTRMFVGSEGTLGVLCEITLKLYGLPESIAAATCAFPTLESAVRTVILIIQSGIPIARMELLDEVQVEACNRFSKLSMPVSPAIFFEFHGTTRGVEEQIEQVGEIAKEHGAADFRWAHKPEERSVLWQARHDAYFAALALRPGKRGWATDVCVPISALAENLLETKADIQRHGLLAPIVGHVGDGNFHVCFVIDPDDPAELGPAKGVNERMIRRALAAGGTCTGEHGVGFAKLGYLKEEHGEAVDLMRAIKQALDPQNIMNPGKVIPPA